MGLYAANLRQVVGDRAAEAVLADPFVKVSFSQNGEDCVVVRLLADHQSERGIYVDLGCHHPRRFSNTHLLHLLGWRGINVDADPDVVRGFNAERPFDANLCSGVSDTDGVLTFHVYGDGAVSTFSEEVVERNAARSFAEVATRHMSVRTFDQIMEVGGWTGERIDFLNIDLEGFDARVLRSIDLDRYRPFVVCAELRDAVLDPLALDDVAFMEARGYALHSKMAMSYVFVRREAFPSL